jgi:hypothetical protein
MTAKAKTTKPRKPAKAGTGARCNAQSKLARHQPRFNGRIISLADVGCGLSEVFANQMAFGAFVRNWLKHADVATVEIGDVIRIAEMNVAAMASLAEMQAKLEERRADQAHDITPPAKRLDANGNVIEMNGHDRIRSRLDGLTGTDRLLALIK